MIFHDIHVRGLYYEFRKLIGYLYYENEPSKQSFSRPFFEEKS